MSRNYPATVRAQGAWNELFGVILMFFCIKFSMSLLCHFQVINVILCHFHVIYKSIPLYFQEKKQAAAFQFLIKKVERTHMILRERKQSQRFPRGSRFDQRSEFHLTNFYLSHLSNIRILYYLLALVLTIFNHKPFLFLRIHYLFI